MLANMAIDHDARAAVVGIARANDGFVSLTAARQADVSDKVLADMTRHGLLERVHLGLYRATSVPWSWEALQLAAVRAGGPRACAACSGAAGLLGLPGVPLGRPEIVVAGTRLLRIDGVRVHRTRELPDEDVTTVAGVRCTTGPRTLIDLAGRFSATHCIELVDAAIGAGIATRARLYERATALRNGRAGVGTLVEVTAPDAEGVFRSTLERRFARGLRRHGLPRPEVNRPLRLRGRVFVPDALWPSHDLVTELHGLRFHSTPAQRGRDDERLNAFTELGLRVLVFTWRQVFDEFAAVAATLRRALGASGAGVSPERPTGALR